MPKILCNIFNFNCNIFLINFDDHTNHEIQYMVSLMPKYGLNFSEVFIGSAVSFSADGGLISPKCNVV
jgi:hypothetical protein